MLQQQTNRGNVRKMLENIFPPVLNNVRKTVYGDEKSQFRLIIVRDYSRQEVRLHI